MSWEGPTNDFWDTVRISQAHTHTHAYNYKYVYESVYLCLYGNNNEWKENLTNGSIPQQFGYSQRVWKGIADVSFLQHFIETHTHIYIYTLECSVGF